LVLVVLRTQMAAIQYFLQLLQLVAVEVDFKSVAIQMLVAQVVAVEIMEVNLARLVLPIKVLLVDKAEQMGLLTATQVAVVVLVALVNKEIQVLDQHLRINQAE
jgi:hypothetical protein